MDDHRPLLIVVRVSDMLLEHLFRCGVPSVHLMEDRTVAYEEDYGSAWLAAFTE